eukprot:scaffold134158_cov35-Tisochrysis_lutea.AAC.2
MVRLSNTNDECFVFFKFVGTCFGHAHAYEDGSRTATTHLRASQTRRAVRCDGICTTLARRIHLRMGCLYSAYSKEDTCNYH